MVEDKTPKPRGGAREGSGRKPKGGVGTQSVSCRMNREHYELVKENYPSLTAFLDKAIKNQLRRDGLI